MKDLEFHVSPEKGGYKTNIRKTFTKACADAVSQAVSSGIPHAHRRRRLVKVCR